MQWRFQGGSGGDPPFVQENALFKSSNFKIIRACPRTLLEPLCPLLYKSAGSAPEMRYKLPSPGEIVLWDSNWCLEDCCTHGGWCKILSELILFSRKLSLRPLSPCCIDLVVAASAQSLPWGADVCLNTKRRECRIAELLYKTPRLHVQKARSE